MSTSTLASSLAWWCSGAVTVVAGQGLAKVLPWPVAVLVGGATAGFVHRTVVDVASALIAASDRVADSLTLLLSSHGAVAATPPKPVTPPMSPAAAATKPPPCSKASAVKKGPQPNDGLLVPPRQRLGMAGVDTWSDVDCTHETTMFLDRELDAIITPKDTGRDFDFDYGSVNLPHVLADASHASQALQALLIPPPATHFVGLDTHRQD